MSELRETAEKSLRRVQKFDPSELERSELGPFQLGGAVDPARRLIELFSLLPADALHVFPDNQLKEIEAAAAATYRILSDVLEFDPEKESEPAQKKRQLIEAIAGDYQPTFNKIFPYISFSVAREADFQALAEEGRATVQGLDDRINELVEKISANGEHVKTVLQEARRSLAEQGVSQEAFHFQQQASTHKIEGDKARTATLRWAIGLGVYAFLTFFLHKIPWLAPTNAIETAQFVISKVLVFGVIGYMLALNAKNFFSHRHNEVVNLHRQNALMTYRSLVEAGATQEARDIILQQAASAIYRLQDTGYVKSSESSTSTVTELIPRTSIPISSSASGSQA